MQRKSTGPKTPRGKKYSSGNALTHGLFALDLYVATITEWEDPDEYQTLLSRLAQHYKPVGAAEELEVQRISSCRWKLSRIWRYENAQISDDLCQRQAMLNKPEELSPENQAFYTSLKRVETEIEATGRISDELNAKMFADHRHEGLWEFAKKEVIELATRQGVTLPAINIMEAPPEVRQPFLLAIARRAVHIFEREQAMDLIEGARLVKDGAAIPKDEVLDRLLRAEAATERALNRAIDRLERLQRRRLGEAIPPPVTVHLTR